MDSPEAATAFLPAQRSAQVSSKDMQAPGQSRTTSSSEAALSHVGRHSSDTNVLILIGSCSVALAMHGTGQTWEAVIPPTGGGGYIPAETATMLRLAGFFADGGAAVRKECEAAKISALVFTRQMDRAASAPLHESASCNGRVS